MRTSPSSSPTSHSYAFGSSRAKMIEWGSIGFIKDGDVNGLKEWWASNMGEQQLFTNGDFKIFHIACELGKDLVVSYLWTVLTNREKGMLLCPEKVEEMLTASIRSGNNNLLVFFLKMLSKKTKVDLLPSLLNSACKAGQVAMVEILLSKCGPGNE